MTMTSTSYKMIDEVLEQYPVTGVYALFSGGHDSLVATHIASQHPAFSGVIHIDTTTGLPETRQFVEDTCQQHGWPLYVKRPYLPYESYLVRFGFPGPGFHTIMYNRLKERPLRQLLKELRVEKHGPRLGKFLLISGVRTQESARRALINTDLQVDGSVLWLPIIHDWTAADVREYIKNNALRRSPVKDKIHMSGECFCGAFARPSEFQELALWYPQQAERIERWQRLVEIAADNRQWEIENDMTPASESIDYCQWGWKDGLPHEQTFMPMCFQCRGK